MSTNLSLVCNIFLYYSDCYYSHPTIYRKSCIWSSFPLGTIILAKIICYFVRCFTSVHLSTDLVLCVTYFSICFDCYYSNLPIYCKFCSWTTFLLGTKMLLKLFVILRDVLYHFICQQNLVRFVTYFYICSDCYYSHPHIYCKFRSLSPFLLGTINRDTIICYFVGCFTSIHMSIDLSPVCYLFLDLFCL